MGRGKKVVVEEEKGEEGEEGFRIYDSRLKKIESGKNSKKAKP